MVDDPASAPLKIGLTGGIASGKSTVAEMFAAHGVPIIDTDQIAREIVEPGKPALEEIRDAFGPSVISDSGGLDRTAMRKRIFGDEAARKRLEAILHPKIRDLTVRRSKVAGGPYQVIVVPLLFESPLRTFVDRILVVDVDETTQIERLLARDAETPQQARKMLAAQASREERLSIADDVISNDGSLDETRKQVEDLHRRYWHLSR